MIKTPQIIVCQSCGKPIEPHTKAVLVSYGFTAKSGRFYNSKGIDVFHATCDKAFRSVLE